MARNHILRFINGYPYVRGPDVREDEVTERQRAHGALGQQYAERGESYYVAEIEPETRAALDRLGRFHRPAGESLASRLEHLETALETSGHVMGDLHWRMAGALGAGARPEWPRLFHELTGEPEMDSGVLLQAIANMTTRMTGRLRGLARLAQADSALRDLFAAREFGRLEQPPFNRQPAVRRFRARFRALLRDYGRRSGRSYGSSTTFETPTWNLDHRVPLDAIATYADQDLDELDRLEQEARRERQQATRRFLGALAPDRDQHARFDLALRQSRDHVRSMENHNHLMEQGVAGVMREAIWWMGDALVRRDRLDAPDDAMHLSLDELREAARDEQGGDLRPLVRRRVAELERRSQLSPPRYLGSGEPSSATLPPALRDAPPSTAGLDGDVLRGEPASRGRYTGRARVFTPGGERPDIERGDILVARNAGQDWTPILPLLGGIVLDEGAVFQHAALVAREYRVPCVLQTREATTVIHDSQRITIDGTEGVVELAPGGGE
jgi:pyruvate,water dikinase